MKMSCRIADEQVGNDPADAQDWTDADDVRVEQLATDLEMRMSDDDWLDVLTESLVARCYPTKRREIGEPAFDAELNARCQERARNLRELRRVANAGQYELLGRIVARGLREEFVRQAQEAVL